MHIQHIQNIYNVHIGFIWSQKWGTFISTFKKHYKMKVKLKNKTMSTCKISSTFRW
jgi:hypothetical protein